MALGISARTIDHFKVGSTETRFGRLDFIGGLELTASSSALGAMSAIRLSDDRSKFLGVMDTGHWYAGRIVRDAAGKPVGIEDFSVAPILDANGDASDEKWRFDAEGLAISGGRALVSFERRHRIDVYSADSPAASRPTGSVPLLIPLEELRGNRGIETIAVPPAGSPLDGALVAVSERSLNAAGDQFGAILGGDRAGVFFVKRHPPFDITDGDFLPNGDLILLERRFSIAEGIGMRIRRIGGDSIKPGATVDGEALLEADFGYQIDNMEGLDVTSDAGGQVFLTLVSDDNHSILQRNLMLEFKLDISGW
nr:esterase-like activity of phytase family protein [Hoeflea marina]